MRGQWLGSLQGDTPGEVLLDLDDMGNRFAGSAYFKPAEPGVPETIAYIDTGSKAERYEIQAEIFAIDDMLKQPMDLATLAERFPDVWHDRVATITMEQKGETLETAYRTERTSASGVLHRYQPEATSSYAADAVFNWSEYKAHITGQDTSSMVYRGQSAPWSLQTTFHRMGRFDLSRYLREDIEFVKRELLPHTTLFFDRISPSVTSALFNIAQHHGFPTPLLDWTYSPYVAAFFAFRVLPKEDDYDMVRIFAFDRENWPKTTSNLAPLVCTYPHVTMMDLPPVENKRAMPQQALAMVTNLHNIEHFIQHYERAFNRRFLTVIDIPRSERSIVVRDLRTMGRTASTMFPGLDGTFEELKLRLFD